MFDNLTKAAQGYFPNRFILFLVAGIVTSLLYQLVSGGGFDLMGIFKFAVGVVVAGFLGSLVAGAASD